jgi:hypothetical protein
MPNSALQRTRRKRRAVELVRSADYERADMERESVDKEIDAVIAARGDAAALVSAEAPPWLAPFEQSLPFRLPPSYRSLLLRYRFPPIAACTVNLFGNLHGKSYDEVVVASYRDPVLSSVTRSNGFIQIGRSASGSYDPICFDLRSRSKSGEAAAAT